MIKTAMRAFLLACSLSLLVSAKYLINDYIISPKAGEQIEMMGDELMQKTGIHAYVITTTQKIGRTTNLYEYIKRYESKLDKPYAAIFFAPNSYRIGVLASSDKIKKMYEPKEVKKYAIEIISVRDSNSDQSRYDVGVVQAFSELADQIATFRGQVLSTTINDSGRWLIDLVTWTVLLGALMVVWIYFGNPIYKRIKNGKK